MQIATHNGSYIFQPSEWLTSSQIKSFFGRLKKARRQKNQSKVVITSESQEFSDDDDDEFFVHAQMTQQSVNTLKKKQKEESILKAIPSNINESKKRCNDDTNKTPLDKRAVSKR